MITEWLFQVGNTVSVWVLGLFPTLPDESIHAAVDPLMMVGAYIGSMSTWVNWGLVAGQVTVVLSTYFLFLTVKILRALLGYLPFIGGNG